MSFIGEQVLLRVYLQNADRSPHLPTYQRIVDAARHEHLAGATVLKGIMGAGYHGIIKSSAWSLTEHVPIIVEIVDSSERIINFAIHVLAKLMVGGMYTLERAAVMIYRSGHGSATTASTIPASSAAPIAMEVKPLSTLPRFEPGADMHINENGILLRAFIGESDRYSGKPLYEAIVLKVRELGLAGATVLRGTEGFGVHSVVHKSSLLELSTDLPIVVEIIDTKDNIDLLLPHLDVMVTEGLVTLEYVMIVMHRHGNATV